MNLEIKLGIKDLHSEYFVCTGQGTIPFFSEEAKTFTVKEDTEEQLIKTALLDIAAALCVAVYKQNQLNDKFEKLAEKINEILD